MKILLIIFWLSFGIAQELIELTESQISKSGFLTTVSFEGKSYQHIDGIGWINGAEKQFLIIDNRIYIVKPSNKITAQITNIRYGSIRNRIVLDISGYSAKELKYLESEGSLQKTEVLELVLPLLDYNPNLIKDYAMLNQELSNINNKTVFKIFGAAIDYKIFVLANPSRLVIDFNERFEEQKEALGHGVIFRRFKFDTGQKLSTVNLLEIAPDNGHFEVLGENGRAQKLKTLSNGAFAAINAGYFDTQNFISIGYLKINGKTISMPSRNRAVVGFGESVLIDRLSTETAIYINDNYYFATLTGNESDIMLYTIPDSLINDTGKAVIVVKDGIVESHSFAPVVVPDNAFVIAYNPIIPSLLEVRPGDKVSYEIKYKPAKFLDLDYAIEAGPLLLKDHQNVYEPRLEHFQVGQKILDGYTQQSAIGVKEDGTVIMLVADNMIASDLIPLFQSLKVKDAMRLDSGSSATLYADGKVLNRFFNRRLVTAIVFIPTE